jgi:drug/metabolite transporter (DMT)-like permease
MRRHAPGAPVISASSRDAASAQARDSLSGIGLTALSVFVFAGSNVIAKSVMTNCPVGETLFVRCAVTLLLLAPFMRPRDFAIVRGVGHPLLHLLRLIGAAGDSFGFYWAISVLPLADVSAIYLASPIYVTGLSALFLGERVGWRRWAAVLVGFVGVLIALRPGEAKLSMYALVALMGSLSLSMSLVVTRRLRRVPNIVLVASQMAGLMLLMGTTAPGWVWPTPVQAGLMVLIGVVSMAGFLCMYRGLQLAFASVVVPFQYTSIIWAGLLGYLVFGDMPGASTLTGAAVIVGAGVFIMLHEGRGLR